MMRSAKAQMKYANKIGAKFVIIIGEDELKTNSLILKNMQTGENNMMQIDGIQLATQILKEGK